MKTFVECLEPRVLFSAPVVTVTARGAAAYEGGPLTRFFYIRRSGDTSQPLAVYYTAGGKATQGIDCNAIGTGVTIKPGQWLRRVEVTAIDDGVAEENESVTLTLRTDVPAYAVSDAASAATIRIISNDEPVEPPPPQPPPPPPVTIGTLEWTTIAPVPLGRSESMGAVIDGKAYVLGGFHDYSTVPTEEMDRYDPATKAWTRVADVQVPLSHAGVAVDGHVMYVAGGYPANASRTAQLYGTNIVRKYDATSDTWGTIQPLPQARATGALVLLGRELHWISGADLGRADRTEHWSLNLDDPAATWLTRAPIQQARNHVGHVAFNGRIYMIGGAILQDEAETPLASMEIYDPASDNWSYGPPMPVARALVQSAVAVANGRIYVAGGETAYQRPTDQVTSFDPAANRWSVVTPLPGKRLAPVLLALDDKTLLGTTGYYNQFNSTAWVGTFA
jgi:N-acetylneuraminic acid mutarotase